MADGANTFEVDQAALDALRERLSGIENGVGKAIAWAANRTAAHCKTVVSSSIRKRTPIKKKDIDPFITRISASPTDRSPQATVRLSATKRLGLDKFGARQVGVTTAQKTADRVRAFGGRRVGGGVVYPIGKHFAESAFMGPKVGAVASKLKGFVWTRTTNARYPKHTLKGPSPVGVFMLTYAGRDTLIDTKAEMDKNIAAAVNFLLLKQSGAL